MKAMIFCLMFAASATHAQAFHKCIGPDGKITFTDVACPKHKAQKYQKVNLEGSETAESTSEAILGDGDTVLEEKPMAHPVSSSHRPMAQR